MGPGLKLEGFLIKLMNTMMKKHQQLVAVAITVFSYASSVVWIQTPEAGVGWEQNQTPLSLKKTVIQHGNITFI